MTTHQTELQKQAIKYADIRKRLFYSKPKTAPVKMVTYIEPQKPVEWLPPKPEWKRAETYFDAHVIESRRILEMLKSGEIELETIERRTIMQIVMETLKDYPGVNISDIRGATRMRTIIPARQMAVWRVRKERPDLSLPAIGRWFKRDHTTLIHSIRKVEAMMAGMGENPCIPTQS